MEAAAHSRIISVLHFLHGTLRDRCLADAFHVLNVPHERGLESLQRIYPPRRFRDSVFAFSIITTEAKEVKERDV